MSVKRWSFVLAMPWRLRCGMSVRSLVRSTSDPKREQERVESRHGPCWAVCLETGDDHPGYRLMPGGHPLVTGEDMAA